MHHGEVFPHSHSATAVLSPNSFDTYTSCVDNIHASQFFEKVTITHLNDGYWSQRIRRVFYCQGTTVYTPGLDVVSFSHNFCILVKETRCTSRNIYHEEINPIPVFNPLDATVTHSESYYKSYTLTRAVSKHSTCVNHPRDDTRAPLSTTYTSPLTRSLKRRPYHRLSTSPAVLQPPRTIQTLRNKIYHSLPSKLELHDPSFELQLRAPITFVISLGLKNGIAALANRS
ncbi:hypothetical protein H4Q26_006925 [Puccinia striiformis f. sp. tritici PST-130]|nr:hypothetical protein H4Q26_006925 [Puccinia striiformis f. sp. tritici PST-130]